MLTPTPLRRLEIDHVAGWNHLDPCKKICWALLAKMKASWFNFGNTCACLILISYLMLGFHFFLELMMIGDAVWRVVVRSFHNFSSACRCQMLTSFRPLVRCSKIAFQHFPTALWAETCSQRCCHHPWSNTFRITTALVIFWGGELDTFCTWDSHVVVGGSWNISRSFSFAGCGFHELKSGTGNLRHEYQYVEVVHRLSRPKDFIIVPNVDMENLLDARRTDFLLGEGSFAKVHLCLDEPRGTTFQKVVHETFPNCLSLQASSTRWSACPRATLSKCVSQSSAFAPSNRFDSPFPPPFTVTMPQSTQSHRINNWLACHG